MAKSRGRRCGGISFSRTNSVAEDWKRLATFYIDVFGCTPKLPERDLSGDRLDRLTAIDGVHIRGIHLILPGFDGDGPTPEMFRYNEHTPHPVKRINTHVFGHIAFSVEDVEACLQALIEHGGSTVGETVRGAVEGVGPIHLVYAEDPEGNIIEIQKWE
ncbi:MAG: VOC family protein [Spirochaetales bacterium]|nr:VOC family protein [Spirochaetales bacterium]